MREASIGDGPVDAVFKAIERVTGIEVELRDFRVRSVTVGEDAQGEAQVVVKFNGKSLTGRGVSTDVIEASALAFLQVINRIAMRSKFGDRIFSELPYRIAWSREVPPPRRSISQQRPRRRYLGHRGRRLGHVHHHRR